MDPIKSSALDLLDFENAALQESQSWRNLLPPEPWLKIVSANPKKFGDYARYRLEAGITNTLSVVSRVRKQHQQTRPVPIVGIPERIAYRALCNRVLGSATPADRSQESYQRFVAGPIRDAYEGQRFMSLKDSRIKYVVESDITAFYEYIDHSRLLSEVQLRTSTVEFPRYLVQLLTEIQGRPFGIPQLLDSSDELSEIYARIIERELTRRGIDVWRYNDDFRISAGSYTEAQARVEALAHEASSVGLVLNERKTRIFKFENYFWKNWMEEPAEGDIEFKPELIKVSNDYGVLDDEQLTQIAHETFARLRYEAEAPNRLDLERLSSDDNHAIGRAIGILTRQADPSGLDQVTRLFAFAPHFSHRIGRYLVALDAKGIDVSESWADLAGSSRSFNSWQRVWLVYIARVCGLLADADCRNWVNAQLSESDSPLLRAEATLGLAKYKSVSFDDIDQAVRAEPEGLLPWYALAAKVMPNVSPNRLRALKESHGVVETLL